MKRVWNDFFQHMLKTGTDPAEVARWRDCLIDFTEEKLAHDPDPSDIRDSLAAYLGTKEPGFVLAGDIRRAHGARRGLVRSAMTELGFCQRHAFIKGKRTRVWVRPRNATNVVGMRKFDVSMPPCPVPLP